jgi:hypothetical protein
LPGEHDLRHPPPTGGLDGEQRGREFVAYNPRRRDDNLGSFTINCETGIDPKRLEKLKDYQIEDQPDEEQIEFNYRTKHERYSQNLESIDAAVSFGALPLVKGLIPRENLYAWMKTKV